MQKKNFLLICIAISIISLSFISPQKATAPGIPHTIWGCISYSNGSMAPGIVVHVKNERTGDVLNDISEYSPYYKTTVYSVDLVEALHGWEDGDLLIINASVGEDWYGENSTIVDVNQGAQRVDIILYPQLPPNMPTNPFPANNSTNVSINVNLSWQCSDPDGDDLSYDVYFNNSLNIEKIASNITNNFYNLLLKYNTTYYWKIIVWDEDGYKNESNLWQFTTQQKPNDIPIIFNATPSNGGKIRAGLCNLSATIKDADGDFLTILFFTNATKGWQEIYSNNGYNGTYNTSFSFSTEGKKYFWSVNVSDGKAWKNETFYFRTNAPPTISNPNPPDKAINVSTNSSLQVTATDPDDSSLLVTFYWENGTEIGEVYAIGTASLSCSLSPHTTYRWYVVAYDGLNSSQSPIWNFTTLNRNPIAESKHVETNEDTSINISLSATDPDNDNLSFSISSQPQHGMLSLFSSHALYVPYQDYYGNDSFSFIAMDPYGGMDEGKINITILPMQDLPVVNHLYPSNNSKNMSTNVSLTISIFDADNDSMNITFYGNGGKIGEFQGIENGIFSLLWKNLSFNAIYSWHVVVNDGFNIIETSPWYFTTIEKGSPPVTSLNIGNPRYDNWITNHTIINFTAFGSSKINHTYYRIWHFQWYPQIGSGVGKNQSFFYYTENFSLNFSWCDEGTYYILYYSDDISGIEEGIHNETYYIDNTPPATALSEIHPYAISFTPSLNISGNDDGVGIKEIDLFYRYSKDNVTWGEWILCQEGDSSFSFEMPEGVGYYQFSSLGIDFLGNSESLFPKESCRFFSADLNNDSRVNILDLVIIAHHWMENPSGEGWNYDIDLNGDGIVNILDLVLLSRDWTG